MTETLQGSCSCGRNHYIIISPPSIHETFSVIYNDEHCKYQRIKPALTNGSALSLRIPLSHLRSTTYAFYPDETHSTIRRVFTPRHAPHTKRHFCGFCGTPLTHWSEEPEGAADWVHVNLGSLKSESVEKLADEGLLETSKDMTDINQEGAIQTRPEGREIQGVPWFEEMIEGSELGRIKRQRGGQSSVDGRSKVEWEVVEFSGESAANTGKRKLDEVGRESDTEMTNDGEESSK